MQPLRTNQCPCSRKVHQTMNLWNWASELARQPVQRCAEGARTHCVSLARRLLKVDHGKGSRWKRWCRRHQSKVSHAASCRERAHMIVGAR